MPKPSGVPDVIPAIFNQTSNPNIRTAMTFGSGLESGWSDTATNPSGATGPFQILLSAHPDISFTAAEDPVQATAFMLPAYKAGVAQVPDSLWASNPEVAAEQAAILAEQPGGAFPDQGVPTSYGSEGVDVVNQRWTQTENYLQGPFSVGIPTTTTSAISNLPQWLQQLLLGPLAPIFGSNPGNLLSGAGKIISFLENPVDAMERVGLVIFGAIIILVGLYVMSGSHAARSAGTQLATAPVGGAATRLRSRASGQAAARRENIGLQKQAMSIGERRVAVAEKRQARLSANAALKAPATGKHAKKRSE